MDEIDADVSAMNAKTMKQRDIIFAVPGNEVLRDRLVEMGLGDSGEVEVRRFPDGESYIRYKTRLPHRRVVIVCSLTNPDSKLVLLTLMAEAARDLGAESVRLIAPYLAYLRQDDRFREGEGVSARYIGRLLSHVFDGVITVDPHLHRVHSLNDLFSIPTVVARSAKALAVWISAQAQNPLLIGPDLESEQWVGSVAALCDAPYVIFSKVRHGDYKVQVKGPDLTPYQGRQVIVFDDIISTGQTMVQALAFLSQQGFDRLWVLGIHGVFAESAMAALMEWGATRVVTSNTIAHPSNAIDISGALVEASYELDTAASSASDAGTLNRIES